MVGAAMAALQRKSEIVLIGANGRSQRQAYFYSARALFTLVACWAAVAGVLLHPAAVVLAAPPLAGGAGYANYFDHQRADVLAMRWSDPPQDGKKCQERQSLTSMCVIDSLAKKSLHSRSLRACGCTHSSSVHLVRMFVCASFYTTRFDYPSASSENRQLPLHFLFYITGSRIRWNLYFTTGAAPALRCRAGLTVEAWIRLVDWHINPSLFGYAVYDSSTSPAYDQANELVLYFTPEQQKFFRATSRARCLRFEGGEVNAFHHM
jgi:hypothetical protein